VIFCWGFICILVSARLGSEGTSGSEKSGTEVEAKGRHAQGGQQPDAAKERHDLQRLSVTLRLRGLIHQDAGYNRVHGRLPIVGRHFDTRCSFQDGFGVRKNGFVGTAALKMAGTVASSGSS
jgi:hypothetical protein